MIRSLLLSVIILGGCAAGNYRLLGENNAKPPEPQDNVTQVEEEKDLSFTLFPWLLWGSVILACSVWLFKHKSSTSREATDK